MPLLSRLFDRSTVTTRFEGLRGFVGLCESNASRDHGFHQNLAGGLGCSLSALAWFQYFLRPGPGRFKLPGIRMG